MNKSITPPVGYPEFPIDGPLVPGITVLEASAGTGKTYQITNLVLRLITEKNIPMRKLLVVTFTRAATAELVDRTRRRLAQAVVVVEAGHAPADDPAMGNLVAGAVRARELGEDWLRRLKDAQESFDEALISTIHGFCQRMLLQNAFESDAGFGLELATDTSDLLEEIVDDILSKRLYDLDAEDHWFLTEECLFTRGDLLDLARTITSDPDIRILPGEPVWQCAVDPVVAELVADAWEEEGIEAFAQAVDGAWQEGIFRKKGKGSQEYKAKKATKMGLALVYWLRQLAEGVCGARPGVLGYFQPERFHEFLADPETPFVLPPEVQQLLDQVRLLADRCGTYRAAYRADLARCIQTEFDRRSEERGIQSFQDLLRQLERHLRPGAEPERRRRLIRAIRSRFDAALIDEFQDTDNLQWTIFGSVFDHPERFLYLIGDPKQAIYGFRGANIHVYLHAVEQAKAVAGGGQPRVYTMGTNYRADLRLVNALNFVLGRNPGLFGHPEINYVKVGASHEQDRITPPGSWEEETASPLQLRFFDSRLDPGAELAEGEQPDRLGKTKANVLLAQRVGADIVEFLDQSFTVRDGGPAGEPRWRAVGPGDIAVLVRQTRQARAVHSALIELGVPCVISGADSVFVSEQAVALQAWLEAVNRPGNSSAVRALLTSELLDWTAVELEALDAEEGPTLIAWERWVATLVGWRKVVEQSGFMAAFRRAMDDHDVAERLLRRGGGERRLTNLLHISELIHTAETHENLTLDGLVEWLNRQRHDATVEAGAAELRLERDDEAVRVMTLHKAKGLEFPVVFAPTLWDGKLLSKRDRPNLRLPDEEGGNLTGRLLDLYLDTQTSPKREHLALAESEAMQENMRLLYVAVTRARLRCYVYTGCVKDFESSSLCAALHGVAGQDGRSLLEETAQRLGVKTATELWDELAELAAGSAHTVALSLCDPVRVIEPWQPPRRTETALECRTFERRELDHYWRRHSYSTLTRGKEAVLAEVRQLSSPEEDAGKDVDAEDGELLDGGEVHLVTHLPPDIQVPEGAESVPFAGFPAGADAGTFLHKVFEEFDFKKLPRDPAVENPSLAAGKQALGQLLETQLPSFGYPASRWRDPLVDWFMPVFQTPLGGPLADLRLADISMDDRLDELGFDLPLAGGNQYGRSVDGHDYTGRITSQQFARAFARRPAHALGPMRPEYIRGLEEHRFMEMAGFMNGLIDLVFRVGEGAQQRWYIADYKSNRLDPQRSGKVPVEHFGFEGMRYEMEKHNYFLQYHLYTLALHRFLRQRLGPGYSYERNFGGAYYLFIRGMLGPVAANLEGEFYRGVFYDKPHFDVIDALDRLFADPMAGGGATP